jgi:hypothetical protein
MMKKGLLILCFIMIFTDAFSQRIPFGFWNRGQRDTVLLSAPTLKSPVDEATDVDQEPILDWDGVIYATNYVIQLSADTGFSSIAWEHDTTSSKAGVTLGLARGTEWYWRVLAYNQFDTSDWSGAWSFTVTTGPPLTAPVLKLPTDGTTGTIQSPTLVWDAVINADNYTVELSNSTSFASPYWLKNVENTSAIIDSVLDYSTTWYWRATAYNDFDTSDASDTFSFTTISSPLTAPTLLTPTDGAIDQTQSPYLTWSRVDSAGFYAVQISQSEMFSEVPWNANTFDTVQQITAGLLEGTQWYWRVRSINSDTSAWSEVFTFKVTEGTPTARAYYIDATSGKDEYNGRATDQAWKTLDKVSSFSFIAGDTILLKGGETYSGQIKNTFTHDDTTDLGAIRYSSYGEGKAKILLASSGDTTDGINVKFTNHIKVKISNIIVEGVYNPLTMTGGATVQRGIYVWNWNTISPLDSNKISYINISNCEVSKVKSSGIQITPGDFGKTFTCHIDSNLVENVGNTGISMSFNWLSNSRIYGNTVRYVYGNTSQTYTNAIQLNLCKDVTVERNLVHTIGYHSVKSGLGIVSGASKKIRIRYNEIYSIYNNTAFDGEAIDLENGTDSSLVEYNYIHDIPGNAILISWGTGDGSIAQHITKAHITERGSLDSGSSDYNVVRYNLIKNFGTKVNASVPGIYCPVGLVDTLNYPMGKNNQIYNNTIVTTYKGKYDNGAIGITGESDSTKAFNNLVLVDSSAFFWGSSPDSLHFAYIDNNMYWSKSKFHQFVKVQSPVVTTTTISGWNNYSTYDSTRLLYNPLLADPYNVTGDTLNNPHLIETLVNKYAPTDASMANENGAELVSYTLNAPTTDIAGNPAKKNGYYGIGAFVNTSPTPYAYQIETKKWLGRQDSLQTTDQMKNKDSLIVFMKADTLLTKHDILYMLADVNNFSATRNIISDTFNITPTNSPTFTSWSGFKGNNSTAHLRTGWYPLSSSVNFTKNNSSISAYSNTNIAENYYLYGITDGTDFTELNPLLSTNVLRGRINQATLVSLANTTSLGMLVLSRTGSTSKQTYVNDTLFNTATTVSTNIPPQQMYLLARNFSGGAESSTIRELSYFSAGSSLTEYQQHRLTDNIEWYFTSIGIPKVPIKPLLSEPVNADTGVSLTTTLKWENLNNARKYNVQISYASDFSYLTDEVIDIDTNVYFIGGSNPGSTGSITLLNNKTYYWRVRGVNTAGDGKWSQTYSFFTPSLYETESLALFARMTYAPSDARKDLMDSLIKYLKTDTIWSETDIMYMFATTDTGQANYNWKSSNYNIVASGSTIPTFTTEKGFTSNGTTGYLKTNWIPSTNAVYYTVNDGSYSVYSQDNIGENLFVLGANNTTTNFMHLNPRTTVNNIDGRINQDTVKNRSNSNSQGFFTVSRGSSSGYDIYRNGALLYNISSVSSALPTVQLSILGNNYNGTTTSFTTRQISFVRVGAKLSSYRQNILHRRIEWYLNRISAYNFVPSAPILITPHDTATSVSETPNIDWDNVGADYYQIEIDDLPAFATPEYTANTAGSEVLSTVFETTPVFTAGLTYYWRVRGVNANGTGAWSSTYSFTIAP